MNIKKRLNQEAQNTYKEILTPQDNEFLAQLKQQTQANATKRPNRKHWIWATACATLCIVIAIVCVTTIPFTNQSPTYLEKNIKAENCDLNTLNSNMHEFNIASDLSYKFTKIYRAYDSISGDNLYFFTHIENDLISTNLVAVCNKYYIYSDFRQTEILQETDLSGYKIYYKTTSSVDPDFGLFTVTGSAKIQGKDETIYIMNYSEISADEDGTFLEFIQNIVIPHHTLRTTQ